MLRPRKRTWLDKLGIGGLCSLILVFGFVGYMVAAGDYQLVWRDERYILDAPISFTFVGVVLSIILIIAIEGISIMQRRRIGWGIRDGRYRNSPLQWEEIIVMVVLGTTLGTTGLGLFINSALDRSSEQLHRSKVTKMYIVPYSKGPPMHYMNVTDWENPHREITLRLTCQGFKTHQEGETIMIKTKHGFFGHEWITAWK